MSQFPHAPASLRGAAALTLTLLILIASAATATAATKYPYTFTNADNSTTVIAKKPERIVVSGVPLSYPGSVLAAGGNVVGAQTYQSPMLGLNPNTGFPAWIPNSERITNVGLFASAAASLEAVARLRPDLIVAQSTFPPADLANLRSIAPVITLPPVAPAPASGPQDAEITWVYFLKKLAPVFDSRARANAYISRIDLRAQALKGFVKKDQTVMQVVPAGVGGGASFQQSVSSNNLRFLAKAGFKIAPFIDAPIDTSISGNGDIQRYFSTEYLSRITAKYVILQANSGTQQQYMERPDYNLIPKTSRVLRVTSEWGLPDPYGALATVAQFGPKLLDVRMLEAVIPAAKQGQKPSVIEFYTQAQSRKACLLADFGPRQPRSLALLEGPDRRVAALGKRSATQVCQTLPRKIVDGLNKNPRRYRIALLDGKDKVTGKAQLKPMSTSLEGLPKG